MENEELRIESGELIIENAKWRYGLPGDLGHEIGVGRYYSKGI